MLAAQHYRSMRDLLGPMGRAGELDGAEQATQIALVTGSQGAAGPAPAPWPRSSSGAAGIVVGTHALLYEGVEFADLGLVVVDEQHRFGVEQRDALRAKAEQPPHVLVMTATPIPRTVAMTVFGDLEVSTLTELPGGRSPIATHVVPATEKPSFLDRAWQRLREEVAPGASGVRGVPAHRRRRVHRGRVALWTPKPRPGGRPPRCWRWRRCSSRGPCTGCGSASCTAGCPATRRTR